MLKLLSYIKYTLQNSVSSFLNKYNAYYYGPNEDLRYYKKQLYKIKNRRTFVNEDYKKNFSEISFKVAERFESYNREGVKFNVKDYFEFGVFNGDATINFWIGIMAYFGRVPDGWNIHLFDSFEGMPKKVDMRDETLRLEEGDLHSKGEEFVLSRLNSVSIPESKINIIKGYYDESLTPLLRDEYLKKGIKAHFVNIDCDYYSSTIAVLRWIEPLLENGSIIYFDDIDLYYKNPNKGELKAIAEFNELDDSRGLAVDQWIDPACRCYIFWRN